MDAGIPRWVTFANVKGGSGKSTAAYAAALAAAQSGRHVGVLDLDPSGWLSTALAPNGFAGRPTAADVLSGTAHVRDAIVVTDLGVALLPCDRALYQAALSRHALAELRAEMEELVELVIADSQSGENRLPALMQVSDRIVIPMPLDRVSAIVSTDTLRVAEAAGVLDRVGGLLPAIVRLRLGQPEDQEGREVYANMRVLDIGYENIFPVSKKWSRASSAGELPPAELVEHVAIPLLREIMERSSEAARLRIWMTSYSRAA